MLSWGLKKSGGNVYQFSYLEHIYLLITNFYDDYNYELTGLEWPVNLDDGVVFVLGHPYDQAMSIRIYSNIREFAIFTNSLHGFPSMTVAVYTPT